MGVNGEVDNLAQKESRNKARIGAYESPRIHAVLFSCGMCGSCISLTISPQSRFMESIT